MPTETPRLELGAFPVRRAVLGAATAWRDGTLTIDPEAVQALVLQDPRIAGVALELLHPGDSARVLRALDAVEPLFKVTGGSAFPGFNGPPLTVGSGRTHRLAGFSVLEVSEFPFPASGVQSAQEGIVEMSGPGARYSGGADRVNLALVFRPGSGASNADYDDALRRAGLRVAHHLAAATAALAPPELEVFELRPAPGLPRIVWVHQVRDQGPLVRTFLYGHDLANAVPTLLHPNELLDGAVVSGNYKNGNKTPTYVHTRHPSLLALAARHGAALDFAGVIVARGHHETEFLKQRSAQMVAKLAAMLGAGGALCTYEATGNTHIDFMLTVQALERGGIPTASVVHEYGGPQGADPPLIDFVPEAVALASSGGIDRPVRLPAVDRVIGAARLAGHDLAGEAELDLTIQELYAVTATMNSRGFIAEDH
jgi:glycine reductase